MTQRPNRPKETNKMARRKVLICDDEEGIRESLKLVLENHYPLILTDSGAQCLDLLNRDNDIGVVLLDIKMPKVNGMEVLRQIKEKNSAMQVIMVTGYRSVETASEIAKLGACGYIVKPFKSGEILDAVKKIVK